MPRPAVVLTLGLAAYPPFERALRRAARHVMLGLIRLRTKPLAIASGSTLVVAPHQDDATLGCGALIHSRRAAGHPVHVLYLTDGAASHLGHPLLSPTEIAAQRRQEARLATSRLGIEPDCVHFLNLPDGRLNQLPIPEQQQAERRIAALCNEIAPATILLPYRFDGSSEHEAGFTLIQNGLRHADQRPRVLEYPVWALWSVSLLFRPWLQVTRVHRFPLGDHAHAKEHALAAFASQLTPTPPWTEAVLPEGFAQAFLSAETEFFFESA